VAGGVVGGAAGVTKAVVADGLEIKGKTPKQWI
jgi:hypothetical protein